MRRSTIVGLMLTSAATAALVACGGSSSSSVAAPEGGTLSALPACASVAVAGRPVDVTVTKCRDGQDEKDLTSRGCMFSWRDMWATRGGVWTKASTPDAVDDPAYGRAFYACP